jgi:hypothetical protein
VACGRDFSVKICDPDRRGNLLRSHIDEMDDDGVIQIFQKRFMSDSKKDELAEIPVMSSSSSSSEANIPAAQSPTQSSSSIKPGVNITNRLPLTLYESNPVQAEFVVRGNVLMFVYCFIKGCCFIIIYISTNVFF